MTLDEARDHIGKGVVYEAYPGGPQEDGVVTSVGDQYVFVRFTGDHHSKATHPSLLHPLRQRH
jgi:hypothetical protein